MARIFMYDEREFPDPDPTMTPEEVRNMMTDFFPELANASITQHTRDDDEVYVFERRVGTKGTNAR